ncbi:CvfB family protein [Hufsiella ginkgonis]|uniref:RNA-binding protein n=1 Tax=Hufsiella ginkgonis TaxID=2695274 RepID=A0A7K1XXK0_9SPHI|nr:S1-like domain-containing RNA-binding protein [Hufsiella ginkgonis]MXV15672.1 RNA-binding protein [Hufsiella ginkgonis]
MIHIGTYNHLRVKKSTAEGLVLTDGEQDVLLPKPQVPNDVQVGDDVFYYVYHHKDGRLVATSKRPYACTGDFAYLKVVDTTDNGAFLDLGIDKDLFISSKQRLPLEAGKSYVVYVYLDEQDGKLVATTWLDEHLDTDLQDLEEGEEVSLLITDISDLGYSAIINNRYPGLLYRDEVYENLQIGQSCTGYIKKIRQEDGKIDLSMRQVGFDFILESKDFILNMIKANGGVLDLGDKSDPAEIRYRLKMSKKSFKQAIGMLYKERLITLSDHELKLVHGDNKE